MTDQDALGRRRFLKQMATVASAAPLAPAFIAATPAAAQTSSAGHTEEAAPPEGVNPEAGAFGNLPVPPSATAAEVALGGRIFHGEIKGGTCAGCHGSNGKGSPVGPDLTAGQWLWGDGSIAAITGTITGGVAQPKKYRSLMPPLGGAQLSPSDVAAVVAYVWAISREKQR